jgi:3-deoxy-D-manno-octulosonic-acid transferase
MLEGMRSSWFPVYRALTALAAPLAARRLARAAAGDADAVARQAERRGHVPDAHGELWVHAASVGELAAAEPLLSRLRDDRRPVVLTTMTHTAAARARERVTGDTIRHAFAPLDTGGAVNRWLDHTRPARLLLIETELWPVLLAACRKREIPVALVNARLSQRAFRRYRRFRGLFVDALSGVDPVLCQTAADAERFAMLGVPPSRLAVCGNLKFDGAAAPADAADRAAAWRGTWQNRPAWVAGSTHAGEEDLVAAAHARVRTAVPGALVLVVPRHPERADEATRALAAAGLTACRIDALPERPDVDCAVVDRIGVLTELYGAAGAAFVGGSLVAGVGGHNLMEPAAAGRAVIAGPHLDEQQAAAAVLRRGRALVIATDADALATHVIDLLRDRDRARRLGRAARAAGMAERGALERVMARLQPWLDARS